MTCVVGIVNDGVIYMGADRGASDEDSIVSLSRPKIHLRGGWMFGYSGSLGTGQLMEFIDFPVPTGEDVYRLLRLEIVSDFKKMLEEHGTNDTDHAADFLIGTQGRLFEFNTVDWSVAEVEETAVGSGGSFALGSLYTTYTYIQHYTPEERIRLAIEAAITYSPTCQDPIDVLSLKYVNNP